MSVSNLTDHERIIRFVMKLSDRYPAEIVVDNYMEKTIELRQTEFGRPTQSWSYDFILKNITY